MVVLGYCSQSTACQFGVILHVMLQFNNVEWGGDLLMSYYFRPAGIRRSIYYPETSRSSSYACRMRKVSCYRHGKQWD